ncbi:beta-lactamase [Candidatus Koribacter versatilis Ellin345]|uniref:Beta-lactamase n=1 Tax=Koribacter versatilis (strain Ellin345) TaxID=204669 RepID=Q1ISZ8_KORVE|nr:serine hydrolase domain-containing protein [Candidatus Koribacter versatilis]ABF40002.1 beta-lactamase [Candidatus Koribacter versatilis Ellin345]
MRRVFALVLFLASAGSLLAQPLQPKQGKALMDLTHQMIETHHIPGASVGVVTNGTITTWADGLADVENRSAASPLTLYRLASVSKPISAVAAMTLVEQHRLDLDAPIQKYCPAFPEKQKPITTRELLSHTSGVRHYRDDEMSSAWTENTKHYDRPSEAFEMFASDPLKFDPGTKFGYSTYGYTVLGCVIEGASGEKFMDYLQKSVLAPAKMTHTLQDNLLTIIPNRTRYYDTEKDGTVINAGYMDSSYKLPGGGLISDVTDMSEFMIAMMQHTIVSQSTVDLMWTPVKTSDGKTSGYGLGFGTGDLHGWKTISHTGGQKGTSTIIYMVPEKQFGVVILTNLEGQGDALRETAAKIADEVLSATPKAQ